VILRESRMPARSLASLELGDLVEIRVILFELVRSQCWGLRISEGDVVQCLGNGDGFVTVARADGSRTDISEECAAFIGVEPFELFETIETPAAEATNGRTRSLRRPAGGHSSPPTVRRRASSSEGPFAARTDPPA
jgi:hypothetical protein